MVFTAVRFLVNLHLVLVVEALAANITGEGERLGMDQGMELQLVQSLQNIS